MLAWLLATAIASPPSITEPLRTGAARPHDAAVVIGIENYPFLPDVRHAYRDADAVHALLVHTVGVPPQKVAVLKGGNREQIQRALRNASEQVTDDGRLWVYFAGHGASSPRGEPLLVADDARQDIDVFTARSVPITDLTRSLDVPAVIVLDACWTGRSRDGEDLVPGSRFTVPVWVLRSPDRVAVWTGASVDQVSGPYEAARHGLFTYFWVGALRGWADGELDGRRDGVITATEAQTYVQRMMSAVQAHTQVPTYQGPGTLELVAARRLERAPATDTLPSVSPVGPTAPTPAPERPEAPAPRPVAVSAGFTPPLRYVGGKVYEDAVGKSIDYVRLQRDFGKFAAMQRVEASLGTGRTVQGAGWATVGIGALVLLSTAAVYGIEMSSYRFWADNPDFGPDRPRPTGMWISTGIIGAGALLVTGGAVHNRIQRRRVARIVNDRVGR